MVCVVGLVTRNRAVGRSPWWVGRERGSGLAKVMEFRWRESGVESYLGGIGNR